MPVARSAGTSSPSGTALAGLSAALADGLRTDEATRALYATDASDYRELPLGVACPKDEAEVRTLVLFAREHGTSLIPRTAGTSLAGQVVGPGIVVDVSRHMTRILEIDATRARVRVQPGVVRNELNLALAPYGLCFGPETATQNRAMIGGMVGNNSCGSNSLVYGTTRDHILGARAVLSDGSTAEFGPVATDEFRARCAGNSLENALYRQAEALLGEAAVRDEIERQFPKKSIHRRCMGYALDSLAACEPFSAGGPPFNFCRMLAGSEGTLAFLTEITLACVPLPPRDTLLVCVHCATIDESLRANLIALRHSPRSSELLDRYILDCTKTNLEQSRNRFFIEGDPEAMLVVEFGAGSMGKVEDEAGRFEADLRSAGLGSLCKRVSGADQNRVWNLRKAALGLLANVPGDGKPAAVVEDTAVDPADLPDFVRDFDAILDRHHLLAVHYGHAGSGELHLRPILNLKDPEGRRLYRVVATEVAHLVKRYRGSLSGEHGDGRLRGEFLPLMVGEKNYALFRSIKATWDPSGIFNPGKITDAPPMDTSLRYEAGQATREFETVLDFSASGGLLRAAERCNGSGDCRKSHLMGGTMCPSYMATKREDATTRARANILREVLTRSPKADPFDSDAIAAVMDLCLSCKGCRSECPSNVDVARLKAEWLQRFHDARGVPLRSRLVGGFASLARMGSLAPGLHNFVVGNPLISGLLKRAVGFAPQRSLPRLHPTTLRRWHRGHANRPGPFPRGRVHLFCDEFTDYNDTPIGIKAVRLLNCLGYEVLIPAQVESGRAKISKGLLRDARRLAIRNIELLKDVVTDAEPLIGIEPSAILGFRDEFPDMVPPTLREAAKALSGRSLLIDEFIAREAAAGRIPSDAFTDEPRSIRLHGHCHQKALASLDPTIRALELPRNYKVQVIPSGCCGMAGSFGFEKEHFAVSQLVGELVLFPAVRGAPLDTLIAASGTSCRHQIADATGRRAFHPVEILHDALRATAAPA